MQSGDVRTSGGAAANVEGLVSEVSIDDVRERARVLSVFGAFNAYVLIQVPAELAAEIFGELPDKARPDVVEAVEGDVAKLPAHLAASALAQTAIALAYELQDPYNSATSKSMCAAKLMDAMATLRELAPPADEKDEIDDLKALREERRRSTAS